MLENLLYNIRAWPSLARITVNKKNTNNLMNINNISFTSL